MSNLKALKSRIKSVSSTQKITKAMKMVAASRLKKAKSAVESSRPYATKIDEIISAMASSSASAKGGLDDRFPLLTGKGKRNSHLIILLSSDRGLCGGLNSSVVRFAKNKINELKLSGKEVKIICVGKKGYEQLKTMYGDIIVDNITDIFKNKIEYKAAKDIANKVIEKYKNEEFDVCQVIYSKFITAISQEPIAKQLIPAQIPEGKESDCFSKKPLSYEPSQEEILDSLLPRNIAVQIYNELLENSASEQGARMAAMEAATNNASKMIKNLTLVYNRTRQSNITRELIDIISGANAV